MPPMPPAPPAPPGVRPEEFAERRDWPGYFTAMLGKPPRDTLLDALARFEREGFTGGFAVDLGCGEGRDSAELLRRGWRVLAIDGHPSAFEFMARRTNFPRAAKMPGRFETRLARMEDADLPACDLLNASFSLPFVEPARFDEVWARIVSAVRPGGRFAGQFFGDRDSWASLPDRSHQTRARVDELLAPFEVEQCREEERDGGDCTNTPKRWHVFHVVARKR